MTFSTRRNSLFVPLSLIVLFSAACSSTGPISLAAHDRSTAIAIPAKPQENLLPRMRVADSLDNPRGFELLSDDTLLVAQAGKGLEADTGSGALTLLTDSDGDGVFEHHEHLLRDLPSKNILNLVRRDEVFGMADVVAGNGTVLVSAAFFGGPSKIYEVKDDTVSHWATVNGNINDLAFSEKEAQWIAVSSSSEQVMRLAKDQPGREILEIPDLPEGQDPVPGYLRYEPDTGGMLVSLFSGSPLGEEGGDGTEIIHRAGGVIRIDTSDGSFEWVVSGLTAPTDLALDDQGRLYILEFCSDFLEPVATRDAMYAGVVHGGFKRYSGRLLRVDLQTGAVETLANDLDGPTNLHLTDNAIFIAQGMGTPGRKIPKGDETVTLTGFIDKVVLE